MKIFRFLFSGAFMGILLIVFATAIGYATFVENDYDAQTARALIYNARWFEILMLLMVVNFIGMIFTKHLYLKSKWNILIIHVALIIILLGAGLTRYLGFEGQMRIREGQTSNSFYTIDYYFNAEVVKGQERKSFSKKVMLSSAGKDLMNEHLNIDNETVSFRLKRYIPNATKTVEKAEKGERVISLIVGGQDGRHDIYVEDGSIQTVHEFGISYNDTSRSNLVNIIDLDQELWIRIPGQTVADTLSKNGFMPLAVMTMFQHRNHNFMVKEIFTNAVYNYEPALDNANGLRVAEIEVNNESLFIEFGKVQEVKQGELTVGLNIGQMKWELPFALHLNKFEIERYPGSNSPSSFASDVTLIDPTKGVELPYKIYMNNILEYDGYRFYQSSYDKDEKGTVLSVNHDYWGTLVTYIGYAVLFVSLIASFFTRKTRFVHIRKQIQDVHLQRKKQMVSILIPLLLTLGTLESIAGQAQDPFVLDKAHAASFGKLLVQNKEGRIEPANTVANKLIIKLYKTTAYDDLNPDQVLLSILLNPNGWHNEELIIIRDEAIREKLGIKGGYASFRDFFDAEGRYKLSEDMDAIYAKKPAMRGIYDKEVIRVDERLNVYYMALNSSLLQIFPVEGDQNNQWISPVAYINSQIRMGKDTDLYSDYMSSLQEAVLSGDYSNADLNLKKIADYQLVYGAAIAPSETKINLEILYNKINIFKKLFPVYLLIGSVLIGLFFIQLYKPQLEFRVVIKILVVILLAAFVLQTLGLGIRWYISGHAPWSNGYESMIYIAWATMLAGFFLMKESPVTLGVTAMLAGITLLTAHMSWLDPEITNLVPVLKSYWLTFHVATITASYGFLGLACMMGFLNLCLITVRRPNNIARVNLALKELSLITELAMIVGLILLVIGNFLGGIWANESWGRYWGWDPKETWTLVTIILYSFTLHMTLIPAIRNKFTFNFMAIISFGAVLMTYFGVNYYLSGLHSYAAGDSVPIPRFVYYTLIVLFFVSALAAYNEYKLKTPEHPEY